jgi:formylglycine-generating enzyme required for sulfatase activity
MVLVPAGRFDMGSNGGEADEKPVHGVYLDSYYIDAYEVTNERYAKFLNERGRDTDDGGRKMIIGFKRGLRKEGGRWVAQPGYETHPAVCVTWYGASQYAKNYRKRLPTEAEWERACRAARRGKWCFGEDEGKLVDYAWYDANSGKTTHPVGRKKPNALGLYDMHGNVWEWCADWYGKSYYDASPNRNPRGPEDGELRILRGGSWSIYASSCRSAYRFGNDPAYCNDRLGFRCAMSPTASEAPQAR